MMTVAVPLKEPLRGNFIMEPVPITKVLIASSLCTGMMPLGSFSVSVFNLDCLIWMSGDHRVFCEALCPSTSVEPSTRPETASVCAETVKINGELIQAKLVANQTTETSVARISLHETIKIPPNSMMTVAVPLKEPLRGNFIMEPVPMLYIHPK
jgi:hypothetical protein